MAASGVMPIAQSRALGLRCLFRPVLIEAVVAPLCLDQLLVGAVLDDLAVLQYDDVPRLADRGEAVGDDDRRASCQQAPQALLDAPLGVQIDVGGGLIEDQNA